MFGSKLGSSVCVMALLGALTGAAHAAVVTVNAAALVGTKDANDKYITMVTLSSITTAEGTYDAFLGATASTISPATGVDRYWLESDPGSNLSALSDARVDSGMINSGAKYQFGKTLTPDAKILLLESTAGTSDAGTLTLIDAAGNDLPNLSLSLSNSSFGTTLGVLKTPKRATGSTSFSTDFNLRGLTFTLADFTGSGSSANATGFRLSSTTLDVAYVALVPEPAALTLLGLGSLVLLNISRRSYR